MADSRGIKCREGGVREGMGSVQETEANGGGR